MNIRTSTNTESGEYFTFQQTISPEINNAINLGASTAQFDYLFCKQVQLAAAPLVANSSTFPGPFYFSGGFLNFSFGQVLTPVGVNNQAGDSWTLATKALTII